MNVDSPGSFGSKKMLGDREIVSSSGFHARMLGLRIACLDYLDCLLKVAACSTENCWPILCDQCLLIPSLRLRSATGSGFHGVLRDFVFWASQNSRIFFRCRSVCRWVSVWVDSFERSLAWNAGRAHKHTRKVFTLFLAGRCRLGLLLLLLLRLVSLRVSSSEKSGLLLAVRNRLLDSQRVSSLQVGVV